VNDDAARQAWLVSVDMGYGHQRAAYALREIAHERIITANSDKAVERREQRTWRRVQGFYETISRLSGLPLIGGAIWRIYDSSQRISSLYPYRDLSRPSLGVLYLDCLLRHGLGRSVAEYARSRDLPFISTFFVPPLAAAHAGLRRIFCVATDVDINRVWVARRPAESPVVYFAPTDVCRTRLLQYGVPPANVHLTGFPLPEENTRPVRDDLRRRLSRLDPTGIFTQRQRESVQREMGTPLVAPAGPLTVTYAVGGAGAQREVATQILHSLGPAIRSGRLRLNLIAGTRLEVRNYFVSAIRALGLCDHMDKGIRILCTMDKRSHFAQFNEWLRDTDILWTKPSELVFYSALGIPLLMTTPLGAHEERNRDWIIRMGAGFSQENPLYTSEWLFQWIDNGMFAGAAFDGYLKAPRHGAENIRNLVFAEDRSKVELKR